MQADLGNINVVDDDTTGCGLIDSQQSKDQGALSSTRPTTNTDSLARFLKFTCISKECVAKVAYGYHIQYREKHQTARD